jgi:hypothetical protein
VCRCYASLCITAAHFPPAHELFKWSSYNIFASTPRSSGWPLPFRFPDQNKVFISLPCVLHARPSLVLDLINLIMFGEAYKLRSSLCSSVRYGRLDISQGKVIFEPPYRDWLVLQKIHVRTYSCFRKYDVRGDWGGGG